MKYELLVCVVLTYFCFIAIIYHVYKPDYGCLLYILLLLWLYSYNSINSSSSSTAFPGTLCGVYNIIMIVRVTLRHGYFGVLVRVARHKMKSTNTRGADVSRWWCGVQLYVEVLCALSS